MRKYAIKYTAAFVLYILIIISFSFPLSETIHLHVLGKYNADSYGSSWYQWFTKKCVLNLDFASLGHTDFIAYPSGKNLLIDMGFPLIPILSIPFQIAMNFPSYYNIFMFTLMAANGLACFMLIYYLYKDTISAFIGGLFFLLNPYVIYQVNSSKQEQVAIFWIPLFILSLLKMREERKKIYPAMGALFLILASLSYWYYGIFLLILTVIFILYHSFLRKDGYPCFLKNAALLLCLYSTCIFLLFFYPVLVLGIYPVGYEFTKPFPAFSDIAAHKTPIYFSHMMRNTVGLLHSPWFIAITAAIILLSLLNIKSLKTNLFYIITAGFFFILSLGPYLKISDHAAVALPYILLYYAVPFFRRLWWPVNCFSITLICTSILAAGLVNFMRSKTNRFTGILLPVTLVIAYLFPYYNGQYNISGYLSHLKAHAFSFYNTSKPHEVYYYLKTQPDCAIIELPFEKKGFNFFRNQIIHGQKIFDCCGYSAKEFVWPKDHLRFLDSNSAVRYFNLLLSSRSPDEAISYRNLRDEASFKIGFEQLYAKGFRFIVFNPEYFENYHFKDILTDEIVKALKTPFKKYPDGLQLYRIEDLIKEL